MELNLSKRTALVTGSARGVGLGVVQAFLDEGARVVVSDIASSLLDKTVRELSERYGHERVMAHLGDMSKETVIGECVTRTVSRFGSLDIVVCNIGSGRSVMGMDATSHDWRSVFEINLFGAVNVMRGCVPQLTEGGAVIFIASIAGMQALKAPYAYSAAKAAILSFVKNLSDDLAPRRIRVNAIAPGNVMFPDSIWEKKMREDPSGTRSYVEQTVPLKTFVEPADIGHAAVFLASEKARCITGTCLVVDGGQLRTA